MSSMGKTLHVIEIADPGYRKTLAIESAVQRKGIQL
jgi:hypothetical protein